jgi:nitrate reductase NapAB chaperone NapD
MLVKSFLAIPKSNSLSQLATYISNISNCEVTSPTNSEEVLVVVMENHDQKSEDHTLLKLHESPSLEHMVLVSSFNEAN